MRLCRYAAGALLSAAAIFSQQAGTNIVPESAMNGAVQRALTGPMLPQASNTPTTFNLPGPRPRVLISKAPKVCAVPLLQAPRKETHDPIARLKTDPKIDPKMAVAPAIPACPMASTLPRR